MVARCCVGIDGRWGIFGGGVACGPRHSARLLALEDATRTKSEFLANMSHEIRTPMSAIIGYTDLLQDPSQSTESKLDCAQVIRRNGEHLLGLINDILDISKIEAGKMTVEAIECSPVQVVEEVLSLMQVRAEGKGLSLKVEYAFPLPRFASDPLRLRQVLVNLVGNAIKFTEKGGVVVRVSAAPAAGRTNLKLEVADTGIGMPPQVLKRIFQAYGQADASTARRFGGSGLGLTISRQLVTMLGGEVRLNSKHGDGTTATVLLSVEPVGEAITAVAVAPETPSKNPAPEGRELRGRILLAEDGPDNQRLITFHLTRAGAEVVGVENGVKAVDAALESRKQGRPFGLILMDMQMPELDGYGATAQLRRGGWAGPIVALTADAMIGDRERCLLAGCDDYMTKPIDRADLVSTCARWMAQKGRSAAA